MDNEELKITRATENDVDDMFEIRRMGWLCGYKNDLKEQDILKQFENNKNDPEYMPKQKEYFRSDNHNCYLAKQNNKNVGIFWFEDSDRRCDDSCYLYGFYVLPEYQKKGIGTALWTFGIEELKKRGYAQLTLSTTKNNRIAKKFYEKQNGIVVKVYEDEMIKGKKTSMIDYSFTL